MRHQPEIYAEDESEICRWRTVGFDRLFAQILIAQSAGLSVEVSVSSMTTFFPANRPTKRFSRKRLYGLANGSAFQS